MNNIPTELKRYFTKEEINNLIDMKSTLFKCKVLVERVFKDMTDKAGEPYIYHLYRVAEKQNDMISKSAALLHDIIEDINDINENTLRYLSIDEEVISIVKLLTKSNDLTYEQEISKIIKSGNYEAISIKYADIMDNANIDRLNKLNLETKQRLENKYNPQLIRLRRFFKYRCKSIKKATTLMDFKKRLSGWCKLRNEINCYYFLEQLIPAG